MAFKLSQFETEFINPNYSSVLEPQAKALEITKVDEGIIYVPPLGVNHKYNFDSGLYRWEYKGSTIKCGLFGEGIKSNANSRYVTYRNAGKHLNEHINKKTSNGSMVPIKCLNNLLKVGESICVYFYKVKNPTIVISGQLYQIHLASLEEKMKNFYKKTLLLN